MSINISGLVLSVLLLLVPEAPAVDNSWYTSASISCSDPLILQDSYMNGSWFYKYLNFHYVHVSHGTGYVELSKADYDTILAVQPQSVVLESHQLTTENAKFLRAKLFATSKDAVVPVTAAIISPLLNYVQAPGNYVAGGFIKYLLSRDAAVKADARGLSEVTAEGGRVDRLLAIGADSARRHSYLLETFDYRIQVGNEARHYPTISCTYAVKIMYKEFVTQATSNNKIFRKAVGERWDRIDIDTNRAEQILYETGRDDDYLYLNENDPNNRINDAYRISLNGGPWQTKGSDGTWRTLCSKVVVR